MKSKYWKEFMNLIEDTKEEDFLWLKLIKRNGNIRLVARSDLSDNDLEQILPRIQEYLISNAEDIRQFQSEWNNSWV